ncbi:MAG: hypothetical protein MZV49_04015 [Rhodopseudomonas palustris]|nr:hypothetical protein [Rhodopseudomonas palustris]
MLVAAMNPCPCGCARRPGACLPLHRPALRRRLSGPDLRPAARPHRSAHRSAGGDGRRSDPAAARRGLGARSQRGSRAARDRQTAALCRRRRAA